MKVRLMFADRDFDILARAPDGAHEVIGDLGLAPVIRAMGGNDPYLVKVATVSLFDHATTSESIRYRQEALIDAAANLSTVRAVYALAVDAGNDLSRHVRISIGRTSPERFMYRSRAAVKLLSTRLDQLATLARERRHGFSSAAFDGFFGYLTDTFDRGYLAAVTDHLDELEFAHGTLISARLGPGSLPTDYLVRRRRRGVRGFAERAYGFRIDRHDPTAAELLGDVRGRGLHRVAAVLAQAADELERFFATVQWESGFYLCAARLTDELRSCGGAVCFPSPGPGSYAARALGNSVPWRCRGLYDAGLALRRGEPIVGNDVDTRGAALMMITGANQGGKSTFLRSIGTAQLMMQAGLPVAATEFSATVRSGVHTHVAHAEDPTMTKGHFDEELERMSRIVDRLCPGALVLLDESFASMNEREASALAGDVVAALVESGHQVCYVTHMYELAQRFYVEGTGCFLRAERRADESRTFRLLESGPIETSFGADLWREVFGEE